MRFTACQNEARRCLNCAAQRKHCCDRGSSLRSPLLLPLQTQISSGLSRLGPPAQDPPPGASLHCDGNLGRELLSHIHNKFYDVH